MLDRCKIKHTKNDQSHMPWGRKTQNSDTDSATVQGHLARRCEIHVESDLALIEMHIIPASSSNIR